MRPLLFILLLALGTVAAALEPKTADGYAIPETGHVFSFPRDHGAHPDFKIEWWYITGHLWSENRQRYGFQATFFRFAGSRLAPAGTSAFGNGQLYLAHMALTDANQQTFMAEERVNRAGWDAHAAAGSLDVANGGWLLKAVPETTDLHLLGAVRAEAAFDLTLSPDKPLVVFGENSVSRKGADPAAASYYLTYSRLKAAGTLVVAGQSLRVAGQAWMDHEISSSQLSGGEVGWDWVSLQFTGEPRELMLYRLRHADGSADAASRLQWVDPNGHAQTAPFRWEVLSRWKSPTTGADYPARVRLTTTDPQTGRSVAFTLEPVLANQEINGAVAGAYWEGACRVLDADGREVGSAYLELTGYAGKLGL